MKVKKRPGQPKYSPKKGKGQATDENALERLMHSWVESWNEPVLPPLADIGLKFGRSIPLIRKALEKLRSLGLVQYRRGSKIVLPHLLALRPPHTAPTSPSKNEPASPIRLYHEIRADILSGRFPPGSELPNQKFWIQARHVSSRTTRDAYAYLLRDRLCEKRGKRFFVCRAVSESRSTGSTPVILVPLSHDLSWHYLCQSDWMQDFCLTWMRMAQSAGIEMRPVSLNSVRSGRESDDEGSESLGEIIRNLGGRYWGSILAGFPGEYRNLSGLLAYLGGKGKPVAWIDRAGEDLAGNWRRNRRAHRFYFDERAELREAARSIAAAGHRCCGMVHYRKDNWLQKALPLFAEELRKVGCRLKVEHVKRPIWKDRPDGQSAAQVLRRLEERGIPLVRDMVRRFTRRYPALKQDPLAYLHDFRSFAPWEDPGLGMRIVWHTPGLAPLLRDPEVTCLISPHAEYARIYHHWLQAGGIEVPREISLLTFSTGAYRQLELLPICRIDPGMAELAQASFSLFLPAWRNAQSPPRERPSRPSLLEHGSLGPPGIRPIDDRFVGNIE